MTREVFVVVFAEFSVILVVFCAFSDSFHVMIIMEFNYILYNY